MLPRQSLPAGHPTWNLRDQNQERTGHIDVQQCAWSGLHSMVRVYILWLGFRMVRVYILWLGFRILWLGFRIGLTFYG